MSTNFCASKISVLATLLLVPLAGSETAFAQGSDPLRSCPSISADPDGDGFGWVLAFNYASPTGGAQRGETCIVNSETEQAPEYTNRETGQPVRLERAYWDGNADLANREISCQDYGWNEASSSYEKSTRNSNSQRRHRFFALSNQAPWAGHYAPMNSDAELGPPITWTVNHGLFHDTDYFEHQIRNVNFPATYTAWIEPVISASGQMTLRFWNTFYSQDFTECMDVSGEPLRATGHWDREGTRAESAYVEEPLLFTGEQEPMPVIFNRKTGQQVQFETGTWEVQEDLTYKTVSCFPYFWSDDLGDYKTNDFSGHDRLTFQPLFVAGEQDAGWAHIIYDGVLRAERWSVTGNIFDVTSFRPDDVLLANSMWYEPISNDFDDQGVRYWGAPGWPANGRASAYHDCYESSSMPTSFRPKYQGDVTSDITEVGEPLDTEGNDNTVVTNTVEPLDTEGNDNTVVTNTVEPLDTEGNDNTVVTNTVDSSVSAQESGSVSTASNQQTSTEPNGVSDTVDGDRVSESGGGSIGWSLLLFLLGYRRTIRERRN